VALFDFLTPLLNRFKVFLGPLGSLVDKFKETYTHLFNIVGDATKLINSIKAEIDAWVHFKQDIRFKQRVINLEKAIAKTRDLIVGLRDSWHAILGLINELKTSQLPNPEEAAAEVAEGAESGGAKALLEAFPKIARGLTKLLEFLTFAIAILEIISKSILDFQTLVDEAKRIRLEIEKLDTIFLQQDNKRKRIKLADGGSIRIRVGHLHESL
jgi:hypothetical protein